MSCVSCSISTPASNETSIAPIPTLRLIPRHKTITRQAIEPQQLTPMSWHQLDGWQEDSLIGVVSALHRNCLRVEQTPSMPHWQSICAAAARLNGLDRVAVRAFFEHYFIPYQVADAHGKRNGLITGYYAHEHDDPVGALGIALTPQRSIAVDPTFIPLGMPVFLATTWPLTHQPLRRLVFAQDTGAAIKGWAHIDYFWGIGDQAGWLAKRTRQLGRIWLLLPRGGTVDNQR